MADVQARDGSGGTEDFLACQEVRHSLTEVSDGQRRYDKGTAHVPDQDIARAHRQAREITSQWLSSGWHPALTERWQHRHHRLAAAIPRLEAVLTDVITHPEMLAIARLLISSQHTPGIPTRSTPSEPS
jgi:hypothetical protein